MRVLIIGAKSILKMLINEQSLVTNMGRMPAVDWKQWATDRPDLIKGTVESALENFIEQKWKDTWSSSC